MTPNYSFHDLIRIITIYSAAILVIIDSILIAIASKKKIQGHLGAISGWYEAHLKYGVFKTNIIKTLIVILLLLPDIPGNPQFIMILVYFIHVTLSIDRMIKLKFNA